MICGLFVLSFFATSSVLTSVVIEHGNICSATEFACNDGACVSLDSLCDGMRDCADGSDEAPTCFGIQNNISSGYPVISRTKRQAQAGCAKHKWQCRDGTCIDFDGKCDGVVNCPDWSDESFPLCRKNQCQMNWFRCTYGACVDGTAPCNGITECADNSDELLPRCRNETNLESKGQFRCDNGDTVSFASHCDGLVDCKDGSDETVRSCAAKTCQSYLFQCAYGACVDQGSDCNGIKECADGSDESNELCNRQGPDTVTPSRPSSVVPPRTGNCILPEYPAHGHYEVGGAPNASPGQGFYTVHLNFSCNSGFAIGGDDSIFCLDGKWSNNFPECIRFCKLNKHPSVEYRCLITGDGTTGTRPCGDQEPSGTIVRPECRAPNYYYPGALGSMRCIDGSWDRVATCNPECGRITPSGEQLIKGGTTAKRGELPWHTGIYRKTTNPYMQICGGSLVSTSVVISAAHCFWDNLEGKALPASLYAVALGKLYRPWNEKNDADAQKSDVSSIQIPSRFQGVAANYQDDIAVVLLTITIEYKYFVRPVCIDFDINFDRQQLQEGNLGKVAGWGLAENDKASPVLKVVDLPYVRITECQALSPPDFRAYLTSDKICAGYQNGTALCKGDSGGGLVFPARDKLVERYYLRGIVSTAPNTEDSACDAFALTAFTQIVKHDHFIQEFL